MRAGLEKDRKAHDKVPGGKLYYGDSHQIENQTLKSTPKSNTNVKYAVLSYHFHNIMHLGMDFWVLLAIRDMLDW